MSCGLLSERSREEVRRVWFGMRCMRRERPTDLLAVREWLDDARGCLRERLPQRLSFKLRGELLLSAFRLGHPTDSVPMPTHCLRFPLLILCW